MSLNFEGALSALREGNRVLRNGWNGKGMWLEVQEPDDKPKVRPYIIISDAQGMLVPWAPSQADLFADDWEVFCDQCDNKGFYLIDGTKTDCGACVESK